METNWEPTLFVDEQATALLAAAVRHVSVMDCLNHCVHHVTGKSCVECDRFTADPCYVACDAYEQEEEPPKPIGRGRRKAVASAVTAALIAFALAGCAVAEAEPAEDDFAEVGDVMVERHVEADEQVRWECLDMLPEVQEEPEEESPDDGWIEDEWAGYGTERSYYSPDGFASQGVRSGVASDTETWYSSQDRRHEDTAQWAADEEGYYRDADGYYVVASDDFPEGTVIETSKGEARVLDSGTDSGNVDFYVSW